MKIANKEFWVFDSNECFDRYTIILEHGEILASSTNPFDPQGFGQHCAEVRNSLENYLEFARNHVNWLGKEITEISELPNEVVAFITQNL
jgi:hypothetical protein